MLCRENIQVAESQILDKGNRINLKISKNGLKMEHKGTKEQ